MKWKLIFSILSLILIFSCKKEKITAPEVAVDVGTFLPKSVGTYWVYEVYFVDSLGVDSLLRIDTISILGNEVIEGKTYTKYSSEQFGDGTHNRYVREDNGFIYNRFDEVKLSYSNLTDTFDIDSIPLFDMYWYTVMEDNVPITVPAGTFNTFEGRYVNTTLSGDPATVCGDAEVVFSNWYAEGVGLVKQRTGLLNSIQGLCYPYFESILIEYHIP